MSPESSKVRCSDQLNHKSLARSGNRLVRVDSKWYNIRWLLPLLFIIGYVTTFSSFDGLGIEYLVQTLYCIFAFCLLLTCLDPPFHTKLPVWISLLVFIVAYFVQFYLIIHDPFIAGFDLRVYDMVQMPNILLSWFETISYGFITYCLTSWLLIKYWKYPYLKESERTVNYRAVISILLILIPALMFFTAVIMYIFDIARMSADNSYLPFRLAGWMFHIRVTLIPALLLLLIWLGDRKGILRYAAFGMILLLLHGVSDMLLRSSRGFLLQITIMLGMLFMVTGRITKRRIQMFVVVLLITIILIPIISLYRDFRAEDASIPISSLLMEAGAASAVESASFFKTFRTMSSFLLFRFTGAISLLHIVGSDSSPLYAEAFTGQMNVTKHMTVNIMGYPEDAIMGYAPSSLGWFYLVGDKGMVIIGIFCFILFIWACWCYLSKLRLYCLPVAQALFLLWFFLLFTEGTLDAPLAGILVLVGSITVCELIIRKSGIIRIM